MKFIYLIIALFLNILNVIIFFQNVETMARIIIFKTWFDSPAFLIYTMAIWFLAWVFTLLTIQKFLSSSWESDDGLDL